MNFLPRPSEFTHSDHRPYLMAIAPEHLPALARLFRTMEREDPYSTSAAYYAMTGRKGLWLYGDDQTMMIIARHPNCEGELLVFPPFGRDPAGLLEQALDAAAMLPGKINLARLSTDDGYLAMRVAALTGNEPSTENILDWTYPVHVLDTAIVNKREGPSFRDFRKNVNRAFGRGQWAVPIDLQRDKAAILSVVDQWASRHDQSVYSYDDLVAPSMAALNLFETGLPINGILIHEGTAPVGFIVWEETDPEKGIANSIAGLSIGGKGTDEFAALTMCEMLQARGFNEVCIGGSETSGLDAFKRKMNPVRSIKLQTVPALA